MIKPSHTLHTKEIKKLQLSRNDVAVGHLVLCNKLMLPGVWSFFPAESSGRGRKRVFRAEAIRSTDGDAVISKVLAPTKPVFIVLSVECYSGALASFTNLRTHVTSDPLFFIFRLSGCAHLAAYRAI